MSRPRHASPSSPVPVAGSGRAVAVRLAAEGHRVALTARSKDQLAETADALRGRRPSCCPADMLDPTAPVDRSSPRSRRAWGPVDSAGGQRRRRRVRPDRPDHRREWQRQLDLNLTAPFRCVRRVRARDGRATVGAHRRSSRRSRRSAGEPYIAAYTATKHGVLGPGPVGGGRAGPHRGHRQRGLPGLRRHPDDRRARSRPSRRAPVAARQEARAILEAKQPIGRLITVDEVRRGRAGSAWRTAVVTGQGINVDGGTVQS